MSTDVPGGASPSDQDDVLQCWRNQIAAMDAGDADALAACLTTTMTLTHMTGHVQPAQAWLRGVRRRDFVYHRVEERSVRVTELDGETAVVVGRLTTGITDDGSGHSWPLRMEQDYVRTADGWRCRASRVTLD